MRNYNKRFVKNINLGLYESYLDIFRNCVYLCVSKYFKSKIEMKKSIFTIVITLIFFLTVKAQYSTYYNVDVNQNVNANVNANINKNVNVSGTVYEHKTISTIDYGALQLANAQREKNRLEQQKFEDERQRQIAMEISNDPLKAYDHGNWLTISSKDKAWKENKTSKENLKKAKESSGFKEFRIDYVVPSNLIFTLLNYFQLQNVSSDGVKTDVIIYLPSYNKENIKVDVEEDFEKAIVGEELEQPDDQNKMHKIYFHKKELNRATVYGAKGYRSTFAWEDKFEIGLTDNYSFDNENLGNGFRVFVKVRYYGNKSEVDFEKLEGRRFYLKPLVEKIVSTAKVSDLKY